MTALDAPTQQQPAVPAPTEGPAPGRHRWDKGGPLDEVGRRLIPADRRVPDTWWPPDVPRRCDADTAHIPPVPAETEVTR
ncbi:hypothetical protein ACQSSU_06745 [Micromonospora echinospora]